MPQRFPSRHVVAFISGVAVVGALAAGCGDDSSSDNAGGQTTSESPNSDMTGMDGMGDMTMNDPDATPASEIANATKSSFTLLDTRPPGTDGVQGTAWLAIGDTPGTTLTVSMTGLEPGAEFVGHLHAQSCAQDNGGDHFKFDPNGSDTPPNEIHIAFTAADDDAGNATITNEQPASEASSVVIHPAEATDNRLACADF